MTNIELNNGLQFFVMILFLIVSSILFFRRKKKLDYSYIPIVIVSLLSGSVFYAGLLWILRPLNIIVDNRIFDDPSYSFIIGFVLILFTIISLKEFIEKANIEKEK
ncbi:MAG: hypothetical protein ABOK23_11050 [Candidatus Methanoperedens sp.]|nr:hypothetical protein [Candidatus Methanoperedens sp.]MCZ7395082.1 hypothetical protein [Candidatus Methanoperedens sp.]